MAAVGSWVPRRCDSVKRFVAPTTNSVDRTRAQRHQTLLDAIEDLVATADLTGAITSINRAGADLLGLDPRADLSLRDLHPPHTCASILATFVPHAREHGSYSGELLMCRRDGSEFPVAYKLVWIDLPDGRAELGIVARDLTRAKQAAVDEAQLLRQLQELKTVIDSTSDFVAMATLEGLISFVNPAGMAMCGRVSQDYRKLEITDFQPSDIQKLIDEVFPFVRRHGAWLGEMQFTHRDGSRIPVSQVITVVRNEAGEIVGYATIARNIRESKRAAAELRAAKDAAEAANLAKSEFLANMSHELRTPLNVILGFTQLLARDRDLNAHQLEQIQTVSRAGEHLLRLINDVLEMSKIEAGRTVLVPQDFEPAHLLRELDNMFRMRAETRGIDLRFDCTDNIPAVVHADEAKLRQVLINLLDNAIKFTPEGEVVVEVAYADQRLAFAVRDTGLGIEADELRHLFDAFSQTRTGRSSHQGTGLGLSISRHFVQMLGGDIEVASTVGKGSTFRFDIAVEIPEDPSTSPANPREIIGLHPECVPPKILIVEDREPNRLVLVHLLGPLGFELRGAINGVEAIEVFREFRPDLILMDIRMPVMDGYEATRRICELAGEHRPVIFALTANAFVEDRSRMIAAGCDDVISKPFQAADILDRIARALEVHYLYRDERTVEQMSHQRSSLMPALRQLPDAWCEQLLQATIRADYTRLLQLLDDIRSDAPGVVETIEQLVKDFEYDAITELLDRRNTPDEAPEQPL